MTADDQALTALVAAAGLHPWQHRMLDRIPVVNRGKVATWLAGMNTTVPLRETAEEVPWMEYLGAFLTVWQWGIIVSVYRETPADWHPVYYWFVQMNAHDPAGFEATHDLPTTEFLDRLEPADRDRFDELLDRFVLEGYDSYEDSRLVSGPRPPAVEEPQRSTVVLKLDPPAEDEILSDEAFLATVNKYRSTPG